MTGSQASDCATHPKCDRGHPQGPAEGSGVSNEVPRPDMVVVGRALSPHLALATRQSS